MLCQNFAIEFLLTRKTGFFLSHKLPSSTKTWWAFTMLCELSLVACGLPADEGFGRGLWDSQHSDWARLLLLHLSWREYWLDKTTGYDTGRCIPHLQIGFIYIYIYRVLGRLYSFSMYSCPNHLQFAKMRRYTSMMHKATEHRHIYLEYMIILMYIYIYYIIL